MTREIKSRIAMAKAAFSNNTFDQQQDLNLRKRLVKFLHLERRGSLDLIM
jgi:hypothetical protein